jgi:hypothetical protein
VLTRTAARRIIYKLLKIGTSRIFFEDRTVAAALCSRFIVLVELLNNIITISQVSERL